MYLEQLIGLFFRTIYHGTQQMNKNSATHQWKTVNCYLKIYKSNSNVMYNNLSNPFLQDHPAVI
jgi:hypothetical protein